MEIPNLSGVDNINEVMKYLQTNFKIDYQSIFSVAKNLKNSDPKLLS